MADELAGTPDLGGGGAPDAGASAPITLSDDALFIPPGGKEPVKWKDYSSGFVPKSDLTRMRQQDSQQLQRDREAIAQERAQLQRAAQQLTARLPQTPQADPLADLRNAPYVDGKMVAGLVEAMRSELTRRDQAMALLHQQLQQMNQGYSTLQSRTRQADTQALFEQARTKMGLPDNPEVKALIESEYLAHEGWDTVSAEDRLEHLTRVVKQRYDGLVNLFKADQQSRVEAARKRPTVPPAPAQPRLQGNKAQGFKSAEALAQELWPLVHGSPDA